MKGIEYGRERTQSKCVEVDGRDEKWGRWKDTRGQLGTGVKKMQTMVKSACLEKYTQW